ncbi:S8/S53 family peptidase [uncultured Pontibacter sp.]|uniref:S8/S53 family peptidase n=1 Tax=uncultured Pontibacter sp. TaxID=453356 RepID=UPI002627A3BD|nr:S8/S53 family peptidase [uncultured Pontibacter sp.]
MRKFLAAVVLCLLAVSQVFAQAYVDSKLKSAITDKTKLVQVVVTFKGDGAPSLLDLSTLTQAGITQGLTLKSLPIAGVLATGLQVDLLAKSSRVLSLYLNESLQYENNSGTALTGVDKLRKDPLFTSRNGGFPVSGKGVGIVVNDSGVDGTHPDLQFGKNLKQNVTAATNLNAVSSILPYLILENVPNTDATGGHGTHVAGIVGGTGQASQGLYEGVAPGADLIGYGSGAALLLLDVLSGFDYAITNQARYNIRVITNSFGTTSDTGTEVNPADPITLATKRCVDRNIVVVFSAGNSGPGSGTMTGQYKKAPWVIAVAAGDKSGRLADFSSRGIKNKGGSFSLDGKTFTWEDRPTVTSPGVDIIATRAISPTSSLSIDKDATELDPAHVAYYTHMSGTSMAAPHVAGIVALLLEANPTLTPYQVKEILQQTATNIPNREKWEVGAGYVNAYAAVDRVYRASAPYGSTLNMNRTFRSNVNANNVTDNFTIDYNPATTATNDYTFDVTAGTTSIEAKIRTQGVAGETGNPVNLSLISPSGAETRSGIPVLFAMSYDRGVAVASPEPGTWTVRISGLNGAAFPEQISGVVNRMTAAGTSGLDDIVGHPAEASIMMAVSSRLVDGLNGSYKPDELLKRIDMADYLMMGEGIRQYLPVDGSYTLTDVKERNLIAESVTARGAALRDQKHIQNSIMLAASPGKFNPNGKVNRAEVAYSLVQALGLQEYALQRNGKTPTVEYNGKSYPIEDAATIPTGLEGYVSVALELNMINAYFTATQGPYDLEPVLHASFKPLQDVTRADFAVIITRTHGLWNSGEQPLAAESTSNLVISEEGKLVSYPNPFSESTTIRYAVEQDGPVLVEVFDILGQKVRTLVSESKTAGNHSVDFRAENLPAGTYIYKVEAGNKVYSNKMLLAK